MTNTPNQAESLLDSWEQAAGGIGFHVNVDEMKYICFNQKEDIYTQNVGSLKLWDKFNYLIYWKWQVCAASEGMNCHR